MPLVDLLGEKWRKIREKRLESEESRRRIFESLSAQDKDIACQEIATWLREADGSTHQDDDYYYSQARERISGFHWQLYKLNRPFIWLEKKVIEPLDRWSKRANVFQFFSRVSPVIEAIGVLAIPFVIFFYENQREQRQIRFEETIISNQADIRKQQAVREYLSQITDIYLEAKNPEEIKANENLNDLLEATTLSIFEELSINEDSQSNLGEEERSDLYEVDRRSEVIKFLYKLDWIQGGEPLISLSGANLERANLERANLEGANLRVANLRRANLRRASLIEADLRRASLIEADLRRASLIEADLSGAYLFGADLSGANLSGVNLFGADLRAVNLFGAHLRRVNLFGADLGIANLGRAYLGGAILIEADLIEADLIEANLIEADLSGAYLFGADLSGADLSGVNLIEADLRAVNLQDAFLVGIENLISEQIKSACFWDMAIYKGEWNGEKRAFVAIEPDNTNFIENLKKDTTSDPDESPDCSRWENFN